MIVLGIDQSINSTGWAIVEDGIFKTGGTVAPVKMEGIFRLLFIEKQLENIINTYNIKHIVREGYSFGSKGKGSFYAGEIGAILDRLVYKLTNTAPLIIPPSNLKQYLTGKGNTKKDLILMEVYKRYNLSFKTSDEADSFGLALMGYYYYSNTRPELKFQIDVLDKLFKKVA